MRNLDLSDSGVDNFITNHGIGEAVIKSIMASEDWVSDSDDSVKERLVALAQVIEENPSLVTENPESLLSLMQWLNTGRSMYILKWLDEVNPGLAIKLISLAQESDDDSDASRFFLERLVVLSRIEAISRIYSQERLSAVYDALRAENDGV